MPRTDSQKLVYWHLEEYTFYSNQTFFLLRFPKANLHLLCVSHTECDRCDKLAGAEGLQLADNNGNIN